MNEKSILASRDADSVPRRGRDVQSEALALIAAGRVRSRSELGEALAVAPSSISLVVQTLLANGWITESGQGPSTGGRRPRILAVSGESSYVLCADMGGRHAKIGVMGLDGTLQESRAIDFDVTTGPEDGLEVLGAAFESLMAERPGRHLLGIGVALPGPVDVAAGCVDSPSRMPGWHRFPVGETLAARFRTGVAVENDANAMALGEYSARSPRSGQMIVIKAGTAIGAGFIIDGKVYHGATGAAGDITHVRIPAAGDTLCSCGNRGCLETIASGAAVVSLLRARGLKVSTTADVIRMVEDADPDATGLVRDAGRHLGGVVSAIVNFFNPTAVLLNGVLSTLEPFVAAFRSQLYEGCHPLVTKELTIAVSSLGEDAGLVGTGRLALQQAFENPHTQMP
ncbi:UNVERIFIED_ORG: putative NBD/HSP70 family sugar kinase [Arthrobacter sp. UYEF2]